MSEKEEQLKVLDKAKEIIKQIDDYREATTIVKVIIASFSIPKTLLSE